MNKVILIIPNCPAETQVNVHRYVLNTRAGWWHYGAETWLLRFKENVSTRVLRDELGKLAPGLQLMVIAVPNTQWHGYGPKEWGEWFNQTWDAE